MVISHIRNATKFKQTVLIIDDQPTVLDIHTAILKSLNLNLNIVAMTDPIEAIAWMKNKQVDLIVSDFNMLNMNGMQFLQTINATNNVTYKPIIVITVLKEKALHQQLLASGVAACLTKPVNSTELAHLARLLLDEAKAFYNRKITATN